MSTNLADKVLEIAQKRESERLNNVKEKVLKIFFKICQERINQLTSFEHKQIVYVPINDLNAIDVSKSDFIRICKASCITAAEHFSREKIEILIPDLSEPSENHPIKMMLYQANIKINEIIEAETNKAKEVCAKVSQKLLDGDFKVEYEPEYEGMVKTTGPFYHLFVEFPSLGISNYCMSQAMKIMEQEGFSLSINKKEDLWKLSIKATSHNNF